VYLVTKLQEESQCDIAASAQTVQGCWFVLCIWEDLDTSNNQEEWVVCWSKELMSGKCRSKIEKQTFMQLL